MSNPYTGTVASALRKCQLLLQSLEGLETTDNSLLQTALQEGALLQLWRGYRAFLGEQAHQLQLGISAGSVPESAEALQGLVTARGKFSAEVGELVSLAENPDSWFYAMALAWSGLWQSAAGSKPASEGANSAVQTLIPVRQLELSGRAPGSIVADAVSLKGWLRALTELVQRQRVQSEEW